MVPVMDVNKVICLLSALLLEHFTEASLPACNDSYTILNVLSPCKISSSTGTYNFKDLIVEKTLILESSSSASIHKINVTGKLKIGLLGSIIVQPNQGPTGSQDGVSIGGVGSGGSHAGRGGCPKGQTLSWGQAQPKGNPKVPTEVGGKGGDGSVIGSGGVGGGAIFVSSDICEINGLIQANGKNAQESSNGGGGAGGTVAIVCQQLTGMAQIEARGGQGDGDGGGGSGGMISVQYQSGMFTDHIGIHAHGGKTGNYWQLFLRKTL